MNANNEIARPAPPSTANGQTVDKVTGVLSDAIRPRSRIGLWTWWEPHCSYRCAAGIQCNGCGSGTCALVLSLARGAGSEGMW